MDHLSLPLLQALISGAKGNYITTIWLTQLAVNFHFVMPPHRVSILKFFLLEPSGPSFLYYQQSSDDDLTNP
jgi:hypothetical protein